MTCVHRLLSDTVGLAACVGWCLFGRRDAMPFASAMLPAMQTEGIYACPHCGEEIVIPLDPSAGREQRYTEDCPVCCSPNVISVVFDDEGEPSLSAERE